MDTLLLVMCLALAFIVALIIKQLYPSSRKDRQCYFFPCISSPTSWFLITFWTISFCLRSFSNQNQIIFFIMDVMRLQSISALYNYSKACMGHTVDFILDENVERTVESPSSLLLFTPPRSVRLSYWTESCAAMKRVHCSPESTTP